MNSFQLPRAAVVVRVSRQASLDLLVVGPDHLRVSSRLSEDVLDGDRVREIRGDIEARP